MEKNQGIVEVNPNPSEGFASKVIDWMEKLIVRLMYDSSQPHRYLSGNFAPAVDETPPCQDLLVNGYLPECLNGEFVRVGPNPKFAPVAGYHWFDGDGMIHGIRIKDGKATYVSRYVITSRLKQEEFFGGAKFPKVGDHKGLFGLLTVSLQMLRAKVKVLDMSYGHGTANTGLIYHHGKLLALSEIDKPYALRVLEDGDLQTLGLLDYDKRLTHPFTAHPKVDPLTGEIYIYLLHVRTLIKNCVLFLNPLFGYKEMEVKGGKRKERGCNLLFGYKNGERKGREKEGSIFPPPLINTIPPKLERFEEKMEPSLSSPFPSSYFFSLPFPSMMLSKQSVTDQTLGAGEMFTFGYSQSPPYITYRVISKDGFMHDPVPITIPAPIMVHDFAITENYAIFMDLPLYFRPKEMVKEKKFIFTFDSTKNARFGVLPRYANDESSIKWFELPNCFILHNANAWEEGDEVVLITCRIENPDLEMVSGIARDTVDSSSNQLYEMRFDMITGLASQKKLSPPAVDFPRVNENYIGRRQRFVYGITFGRIEGIVKFDLHAEPTSSKTKLEVGGTVQAIFGLGPGRFGSEAIFVPRERGNTSEEDDGYLIFFVHDENTGKSSVNVIDAKTMSTEPVAVIELPHRVPYGFHAYFVTEEQLKEQANF